jgi:hypothetical protein
VEDEPHLPHEDSSNYSTAGMNYMGHVTVGRGFYGFMPLGITGVLMRINFRKRPLSLDFFTLILSALLVTLAS